MITAMADSSLYAKQAYDLKKKGLTDKQKILNFIKGYLKPVTAKIISNNINISLGTVNARINELRYIDCILKADCYENEQYYRIKLDSELPDVRKKTKTEIELEKALIRIIVLEEQNKRLIEIFNNTQNHCNNTIKQLKLIM
jgi:predicted RNA methylase